MPYYTSGPNSIEMTPEEINFILNTPKNQFTFHVIPKERFDTMLSLEEQIVSMPGNNSGKYEYVKTCLGEEIQPRPEFGLGQPIAFFKENADDKFLSKVIYNPIHRWVYTPEKLEVGKSYKIIVFPKTCSAGFTFVSGAV